MEKNNLSGIIAVIGLGYVGLPLAVEFGKTRRVIGFDINKFRIDELKIGKDSTLEVEYEKIVAAVNLEFSCEIDVLKSCDIFQKNCTLY